METQTIKQEIKQEKELSSVWHGSLYTASDVAHQIYARWGEEAVKAYDPQVNCFTFNGWQERGYKVKKGEKALRSITFIGGIDKTPDANGKDKIFSRGYPKTVCLFYINQVEKREVR
jgi:hypothetical protein